MTDTTEAVKTNRVAIGGISAGVLALVVGVVTYFEGYTPKAYRDPVGILTACYGHTGSDVYDGKRYTRAECDALLHEDLAEANRAVSACIFVPLKDNERAALVSFAYNVGQVQLCKSTLARKANHGEPFCAELDKWVYSKGKRFNGLVKRRAAERALCEAN